MTYASLCECFPINTFWRHTSNPDIHIFHIAGFDFIAGNWFATDTDLSLLPVEILKSSYRICDASVAGFPKQLPVYGWPDVWPDEMTAEEREAKHQKKLVHDRAYKKARRLRNKEVAA